MCICEKQFSKRYFSIVGRNMWRRRWYMCWTLAKAAAYGWWRRISRRTRLTFRNTKRVHVQWFFLASLQIFTQYRTIKCNCILMYPVICWCRSLLTIKHSYSHFSTKYLEIFKIHFLLTTDLLLESLYTISDFFIGNFWYVLHWDSLRQAVNTHI